MSRYIDIEAKNEIVRRVIALIRILYEQHQATNLFSINKYDSLNHQHNFYVEKRIFEIQFRDKHWNILAETKSNSSQYFKVGKIPSKFLTFRNIEALELYLTTIIEKKEIVTSIDDLIE
ncbi:MAG: hypothetical protein ACC656_06335 [Candidatus Heimdallarchaeota archaeon]